ncbi:MAG: DNA repair exonuclease, partial [Coriobacteriia bacterium]|nr:DNA repair exonuclease [Coriobacteriia bacterium]
TEAAGAYIIVKVAVGRGDPRVREELVEATFGAFDTIATTAIDRAVDFVVIAGDAYNSRDRNTRAQLRFRTVMERLDTAGIPVFLASGNHDPTDGFTAGIALPGNVHRFATDRVDRIEVANRDGGVLCSLYGRGYATARTTANLAAGFSRDASDETAIGVLHANVGGQPGYEPYAPCSLEDLLSARMDYWALGHIHKRLELSSAPRIRYSGSPQGLNPKEDGEHGCWVVTMDRGAVIAEEFISTARVLWAQEVIDATDIEDGETLRVALRDVCERLRDAAAGRPVVVRVDVTGRSEAHRSLAHASTFDDIVADVQAEQLLESPWVWIGRARNLTSPLLAVDFLRGVEDFTGDLVRLVDEVLADPVRTEALLGEALAGIDGAFGGRERDAQELISRARDLCLDRLMVGEDR